MKPIDQHYVRDLVPHVTRHALTRIQQRGFSTEAIDLVRIYGEATRDGYVLSNKAIERRRHALLSEIQLLERWRGTVVIELDGKVVTVYRASRKTAKRLRQTCLTG